jgi:hypothetical protein
MPCLQATSLRFQLLWFWHDMILHHGAYLRSIYIDESGDDGLDVPFREIGNAGGSSKWLVI